MQIIDFINEATRNRNAKKEHILQEHIPKWIIWIVKNIRLPRFIRNYLATYSTKFDEVCEVKVLGKIVYPKK